MKVILLRDVAKIGRRFEITNVPDGYALNQLIPKGMAEAATPANLKKIEKFQAGVSEEKAVGVAMFEKAKSVLNETKLEIKVEANEQNHLFKAVSEADVLEAANTAGVKLESDMIKFTTPIKELGEHEVSLQKGDMKATFKIEIVKK